MIDFENIIVKLLTLAFCLRQAYANLPSQAGSSAPWPARRHPPHFGIFRLRDAYVMLTGCLREFSAAAILAKSSSKSN